MSTEHPMTQVIEFAEQIDAQSAVRLFRDCGRVATWRRVNEQRGDRMWHYIVEVKS